ncbi:hypothetical protein [Limnobacter sp.]|uniref:hypothetical protein n=1 Tax=Limnobacter sp. TaxID=2003368 RepID=UPI0025C56F8E|nr:hypothetical protein [Limnobacter sp.]
MSGDRIELDTTAVAPTQLLVVVEQAALARTEQKIGTSTLQELQRVYRPRTFAGQRERLRQYDGEGNRAAQDHYLFQSQRAIPIAGLAGLLETDPSVLASLVSVKRTKDGPVLTVKEGSSGFLQGMRDNLTGYEREKLEVQLTGQVKYFIEPIADILGKVYTGQASMATLYNELIRLETKKNPSDEDTRRKVALAAWTASYEQAAATMLEQAEEQGRLAMLRFGSPMVEDAADRVTLEEEFDDDFDDDESSVKKVGGQVPDIAASVGQRQNRSLLRQVTGRLILNAYALGNLDPQSKARIEELKKQEAYKYINQTGATPGQWWRRWGSSVAGQLDPAVMTALQVAAHYAPRAMNAQEAELADQDGATDLISSPLTRIVGLLQTATYGPTYNTRSRQMIAYLPVSVLSDSTAAQLVERVLPMAALQSNMPMTGKRNENKDAKLARAQDMSAQVAELLVTERYSTLRQLLKENGYVKAVAEFDEWLKSAPKKAKNRVKDTAQAFDDNLMWVASLAKKSQWNKKLGSRGSELARALVIANAAASVRAARAQILDQLGVIDRLAQERARTDPYANTYEQQLMRDAAEQVLPRLSHEAEMLLALDEAILRGDLTGVRQNLEVLHAEGQRLRYTTQPNRVSSLPTFVSPLDAHKSISEKFKEPGNDVVQVRRGPVRLHYVGNPMVLHSGVTADVAQSETASPIGRLRHQMLLALEKVKVEHKKHAEALDATRNEDGTINEAKLKKEVRRLTREFPADVDAINVLVTLLEEAPRSVQERKAPLFTMLEQLHSMDVKVETVEGQPSLTITSQKDPGRTLTIKVGRAVRQTNKGATEYVTYELSATGYEADPSLFKQLVGAVVNGIQRAHVDMDRGHVDEDTGRYAFDVSALGDELTPYVTKQSSRYFQSQDEQLLLDGPTARVGRPLPKKRSSVKFSYDPFAVEGAGEAQAQVVHKMGVTVPKSWDADTLPKIDNEEFKSIIFLQAYDEWFGQIQDAHTRASVQRAKFEESLRSIVERQGYTGKAFFDRRNELDEAMLWYINMTGFLTPAGRQELGEILYDRRDRSKPFNYEAPKTLDELWDLLSNKKNSKITDRDRKMFELVKQIDAAKTDVTSELRDVYELAEQLVRYSLSTTQIALRSRIISRGQERYVHLAWQDQNGDPVSFDGRDAGVISLAGAGGPARVDVGAATLKRRIAGVVEGRALGLELRNFSALDAMHRTRQLVEEARFNKAMRTGLEKTGILKTRQAGAKNRAGHVDLEPRMLEGYEAPELVAKYLNNAMTQFTINDLKGWQKRAMKVNVYSKHILLSFGFFHHQAFLRSYLFTVRRGDALQAIKGLGGLGVASLLTYGSLFGIVKESTMHNMAMKWRPYALGRHALMNMVPDVQLLINNGLTAVVGSPTMEAIYRGGFDPERLRSGQDILDLDGTFMDPDNPAGKAWHTKLREKLAELDGGTVSAPVGSFLERLKRAQYETSQFLFNSFGAYTKTHAALIEFQELKAEMKEELAEDDGSLLNDLARIAADKVNRDFGGLNLRSRSGKLEDLWKGGGAPRNPRTHMLLRALFLAPDWTESNLATIVAAFKKEKLYGRPEELERVTRNVYRTMWLRVALRAQTLQVLGMMLMAGIDDDRDIIDLYKDAGIPFFGNADAPDWKKFRWLLDVDVSPLSRALGVKNKRKYISIWGHFGDAFKWTIDGFISGPTEPVRKKLSPMFTFMYEGITGTNWKKQRFTTWDELLGVDYDKGVYKNKYVRADGTVMYPGMSKGGRHAGQLSRWSMDRGMVKPSEYPSFFLSQAARFVPLQARSLAEYATGNKDGFDFAMEALGVKAHNFVEGRNQ